MKRLSFFTFLSFIILGIFLAVASEPEDHLVRFVYDGDTIRTDRIKKVRYLGVDTPERNEPYYEEATSLNRKLVAGKKVRLEICSLRPLDKHGRSLAYVFADGKSVAESLLAAGLARVFDDRDCNAGRAEKHWALMIQAYDQGRGMWANAPKNPILATEAVLHVGKVRKIKGIVKKLVRADSFVYMNFDNDSRTKGFSVHFPKESLGRFQKANLNPETLVGKNVAVLGPIKKRKHGPFVICYSPGQLVLKP